MEISKILISNFKEIEKESLEAIIQDCFGKNYTLDFNGDYVYLEIYEAEYHLLNKIKALTVDLLLSSKIMFVPFYDNFILKIFSFISSPGIYNTYQVITKMLIEQRLHKSEIPLYFEKLSYQTLELVKIFVETGLNSCKTAKILYLHRNTLNYRIEQFYKETNINIKNIWNANFVYLMTMIL